MNGHRKIYYLLILAVAVSIGFYWWNDYLSTKKEIIQKTKENLISEEFKDKKRDIENFFKMAYQTARTIGLLPSVRSIKGGNRADDGEDVVATGRFSKEGHLTVQQLYNNLASNLSVSEIYCILEGLDYSNGEVPFFMFDSLIIGEPQTSGENKTGLGQLSTDSDTPEAAEDEEYAYYPLQISHFKKNHPVFAAMNLDNIPAISSPSMRTCDNSQYLSKSRGDASNANGILYSVPFYSHEGAFRGIISAIFRLNVLEALLLDAPFLIITDKDKKESHEMGFEMPEVQKVPGFVLANEGFDIYVFDRRKTPDLARMAREALKSGKDNDKVHLEVLAIKDANPWTLFYRFDEAVLAKAVKGKSQELSLKLGALFITTLLLILWVRFDQKRRDQVLKIAGKLDEIAKRGGNLRDRLEENQATEELRGLAKGFNAFIAELQTLIGKVAANASQVASASTELARYCEKEAAIAARQVSSSSEAAAAVEEMSATSNEVARISLEASGSANSTSQAASQGMEMVSRTTAEIKQIKIAVEGAAGKVGALGKRSREIGNIIGVIDDIADQTNLLALNAAIEAARAGEQGRGFAVVADEVRKLAERTQGATREISGMITEIQKEISGVIGAMESGSAQVDSGVRIAGETQEVFQKIVELVRNATDMINQIASAAEEQSAASSEIATRMESISSGAREASSGIKEMVNSANKMRELAENLNKTVSKFQV
ncbi:MAG: methyl-accepting chemotaxis protein [Nitrospinae bacterium]|nr:methyl-accepting chemotaxis protein [Nitrospinota bacterium]